MKQVKKPSKAQYFPSLQVLLDYLCAAELKRGQSQLGDDLFVVRRKISLCLTFFQPSLFFQTRVSATG